MRGVLVEPILHLAFKTYKDAALATKEHICLCRNEDMLYPSEAVLELTQEEFDSEEFAGFELVFEFIGRCFDGMDWDILSSVVL